MGSVKDLAMRVKNDRVSSIRSFHSHEVFNYISKGCHEAIVKPTHGVQVLQRLDLNVEHGEILARLPDSLQMPDMVFVANPHGHTINPPFHKSISTGAKRGIAAADELQSIRLMKERDGSGVEVCRFAVSHSVRIQSGCERTKG
jgi:hypothetical protein